MKPFIPIRMLAAGMLLIVALAARAEHFDIDLTVEGVGERQEAHRDDYPPFEGHNRRPVFHGNKGETLLLQVLFKNANPHEVLKRVSIRYYLVRVSDGSLKSTPKDDVAAVIAGGFTLDFKFQGKLGFKQHFVITDAGSYLLRVESSNSAADHEHFAAIDLDIR